LDKKLLIFYTQTITKMAQLINEAKRFQFLAGLITESQLNEGEKVGVVDVDVTKKVIDTPEVKKIADILKGHPDAAKKLAAALSDPKAMAILSGDSISEAEEEEYSVKERIMRFLKYTGVGSIAGSLFAPMSMMSSTTTDPELLTMLIAGAIVGAVFGAVGGALGTDGFTKKSFEEAEGQEDDVKDQIAQVIAFGKK